MVEYIRGKKYPHLLPEEVKLWDAFMREHSEEYGRFEYDVHVGMGAPVPPGTSPEMLKMIKATSRKRIDVVGYSTGLITIFEVRPDAGLSVIGSLRGYKRLL
ncbi:unnamed protein product, partial [marine sediment metagenome]